MYTGKKKYKIILSKNLVYGKLFEPNGNETEKRKTKNRRIEELRAHMQNHMQNHTQNHIHVENMNSDMEDA